MRTLRKSNLTPFKIIFASHDPGGFNLLIPVIESLSENFNFDLHFLLVGPALKKFNELKLSKTYLHLITSFPCLHFPLESDVNKFDVDNILEQIDPDIIITGTSINSNIERYCINYGNNAGIKTFSFIDSWVGEDVRFKSKEIEVYPNNILVSDKAMESLYQKFISDNCCVKIVGNAHLEKLYLKQKIKNDVEVLFDKKRVLFFSENIFHYYPNGKLNEMQIIQQILKTYSSSVKFTICIRPHPLESKDHWVCFIEKNKCLNSYITLELDDTNDVHVSILRSSMTFGVSSMALIESSILGLYTFSYQVGIDDDKNMLYIPFDEFGIKQFNELDDICSIFENIEKNCRRNQFPFLFTNSLDNIKKFIFSDMLE